MSTSMYNVFFWVVRDGCFFAHSALSGLSIWRSEGYFKNDNLPVNMPFEIMPLKILLNPLV